MPSAAFPADRRINPWAGVPASDGHSPLSYQPIVLQPLALSRWPLFGINRKLSIHNRKSRRPVASRPSGGAASGSGEVRGDLGEERLDAKGAEGQLLQEIFEGVALPTLP